MLRDILDIPHFTATSDIYKQQGTFIFPAVCYLSELVYTVCAKSKPLQLNKGQMVQKIKFRFEKKSNRCLIQMPGGGKGLIIFMKAI